MPDETPQELIMQFRLDIEKRLGKLELKMEARLGKIESSIAGLKVQARIIEVLLLMVIMGLVGVAFSHWKGGTP